MTLHFSHIGLTDARTFMNLALLSKEVALGSQESDRRDRTRGPGDAAYRSAATPDRLMLAAAESPSARHQTLTGLRGQPAANPDAVLAASGQSFKCQGVRIRGPSAVTAIVNSKWAASEPSWL